MIFSGSLWLVEQYQHRIFFFTEKIVLRWTNVLRSFDYQAPPTGCVPKQSFVVFCPCLTH